VIRLLRFPEMSVMGDKEELASGCKRFCMCAICMRDIFIFFSSGRSEENRLLLGGAMDDLRTTVCLMICL